MYSGVFESTKESLLCMNFEVYMDLQHANINVNYPPLCRFTTFILLPFHRLKYKEQLVSVILRETPNEELHEGSNPQNSLMSLYVTKLRNKALASPN